MDDAMAPPSSTSLTAAIDGGVADKDNLSGRQ
jgi:hypothetical protein